VATASLGMSVGISPVNALAIPAQPGPSTDSVTSEPQRLGAEFAKIEGEASQQGGTTTIVPDIKKAPPAEKPGTELKKDEWPRAAFPKVEKPGAEFPKVEKPGAVFPKVEREALPK